MASLVDLRYALRFCIVFFLAGQFWSMLWMLGVLWHSDALNLYPHVIFYDVDRFKNGLAAFLVSTSLMLIPALLYIRHQPIAAQLWAYSIIGFVLSLSFAFGTFGFTGLVLNFPQYSVKFLVVAFAGLVAGACACLLMQPRGDFPEKNGGQNESVLFSQRKGRILVFLVGAALISGALLSSISILRIGFNIGQYIDVDISNLAEDQMQVVELSGKPVYILRRSETTLQELAKPVKPLLDPESKKSQQPDITKNPYRSIKPEIFVAYGICTHRGCAPKYISPADAVNSPDAIRQGHFFCPCQGGVYDLAGRVFAGTPAPRNLDVPAYEFLSENNIRLYYPGFSHYFF